MATRTAMSSSANGYVVIAFPAMEQSPFNLLINTMQQERQK